MLNDGDLLLKAIADNPLENTPRLMYADYLQENGQDEVAELYRRPLHLHSPFESLVGKVVTKVETDENYLLVITTEDDVFAYSAHGDCCSNSWFYRVLNANNLIGKKIVSVVTGLDDVDPEDGLCQQEYDSVYSYCILSENGGCEVTFRNSSNGYYGGWLEVDHNRPSGIDLKEIAASWQVPAPPPKEEKKEEDNEWLAED